MNNNNIFTCIGKTHKGLACPATKEAWMNMVNSPELKELYERIAAAPYGSSEQDELKAKPPFRTPHCCQFKDNHRNRDSVLVPLRRVVIDLDKDKGRAEEICQKALDVQKKGFWTVVLVEKSARGGVHIDIDIPQGMTAMEAAKAFANELGEEFDASVPTPEHFLYMSPNIMYINEERFFHPTVIPLEEMHTVWPTRTKLQSKLPSTKGDYEQDYVTPNPTCSTSTYEGIPMEDIVHELEHCISGGPAIEGTRNIQVFDMARLIRHLTGNNLPLLKSIIPLYGLSVEEHESAIRNALQYTKPMPGIPHDLSRAINRAKKSNGTVTGEDAPPAMPDELPSSMQHILQSSPDKMKEGIAMGVFSPLRVLMSDTKFHYIDNSFKEPCFINFLVAEQGSGKSAIKPVIDAIMERIVERDQEARRQEAEWREKYNTLGANKDKPKAPQLPIQWIYPNTTLAALNKRAQQSNNLSLYTYCDEAEKLIGHLPEYSSILRSCYDSERDGQERVSSQSVCGDAQIRWSLNISTQPSTIRRLMANELSNGLLSRSSISAPFTSDNDWGEEIPVLGDYGEQYRSQLKPYLDRLSQVKGLITCPEAEEWVMAERIKHIEYMREMDAKYLLPYLWRALQSGFWRACILYIMEGNKWSQEIADFCSWSVSFDMYSKIKIFGDLIEKSSNCTVPDNSRRRTNLLVLLPDEFTRDDARNMRRDVGKGTSSKELKNMLAQWVHSGKIKLDEDRNVYVKQRRESA